MAKFPLRAVSGIRPSKPHLGHYFGALRWQIELQNQHPTKCFYFIADLHAITSARTESVNQSKSLNDQILEVACTYLALGLDPQKACLYRQSSVEKNAYLMLLLTRFASPRDLQRNPVTKNSSAPISASAYSYRLLMSADIIGMQATLIPAGSDQSGNISTASNIVKAFNHFSNESILPKPSLQSPLDYMVPGIDGKKMIGSNSIELFYDDPSVLKSKIFSIRTDSKGGTEAKDPTDCNVFKLYNVVAEPDEINEMVKKYKSGVSYAQAKKDLYKAIRSRFDAYEASYRYWKSKPSDVLDILHEGASIAEESFEHVLDAVCKKLGLRELAPNHYYASEAHK